MAGPKGPRRANAVQQGNRHMNKLIVIGCLSLGLLAGFLMGRSKGGLGSRQRDGSAAVGSKLVQLGGQGDNTNKDAQYAAQIAATNGFLGPMYRAPPSLPLMSSGSGTTSSQNAPLGYDAPSAPQVVSVAAPPPHVLVDLHDMRHPHNVGLMMRQGSTHDEHKASFLQELIHGKLDAVNLIAGRISDSDQQFAQNLKAQQQLAAMQAMKQAELVQKQGGSSTGSLTGSTNGASSTAPGPGCKKPGAGCGLPGDTIHTIFTSNGSPYQNFQARIMIASWKQVRATRDGGHLVAMSRILHRTTPDELMDEVDTFRAEPLQPACDKWCWFPVADRANAVQQWINAVEKAPSMQKAPWVLLLETDYVWIKPLQSPGDAYDLKVAGRSFAYDYIYPNNIHVKQMLQDNCPGRDISKVPNSGPAPVLARFEDFKAATPLWEKLSKWIETHEEAKKVLGWVREMYAWDIGVACCATCNILNQPAASTVLMSQPPHDASAHNAAFYHYTWASEFMLPNKTKEWVFDKRTYTDSKIALKVPQIPLPPPFREGAWKLPDGVSVTLEMYNTIVHMLNLMNSAASTLTDLTQQASKITTAATPVSPQGSTSGSSSQMTMDQTLAAVMAATAAIEGI